MYDNVLLAEASLRRNFQDLRFCPQDSQEDMAASSRRSLTRLQEHLPEAACLDARGLLGQGLPYLQELLLPGGFRRLNSAGFVFDSGRNLGAAINMDEHVVFKASGSLDQAEQLVAAVRALEEEVRDERHPYAHDEAYGYLSYKPLLSGSGLHLGAVMHLPLLHFLKQARPMSLALQETAGTRPGCSWLPTRAATAWVTSKSSNWCGTRSARFRARSKPCSKRLSPGTARPP